MRIQLFSFLVILLFPGCDAIRESMVYGEEEGIQDGMPSEDGKCFARCLIMEEAILYETEYPIFTGDRASTEIALDTIQYMTKVAFEKWIKKKAAVGCRSSDPNDCMVWCLVSVPEQYKTIVVVRDTSTTNEYEMLSKPTMDESRGNTESREILCDKDINGYLVSQLQMVLSDEKLYSGEIDGKMDKKTREALVNFQKGNGLPIGHLDFHTLDYMGLDY